MRTSPAVYVAAILAIVARSRATARDTGTFTLRLRFPNGYRIAPHTHPTIENVTILAGAFLAGMGTQFDESKLQAYRRNAFVSVPAEHAHFAMARGETVVQVPGLGPFVLTYVNRPTATR